MQYTAAQMTAIQTISQNLQIIACAGSGKTQVVSERVIEILRKGVEPRKIVAFTFTERAAAELKDRILRLCRDEFGDINGLAEMYVGTIHGFALQFLQDNVYQYYRYTVLSDVQSRLLVDRFYRQSGMASLGLKRYVESGLFLDIMSTMREAELVETIIEDHVANEALQLYRNFLDGQAVFDYTAILEKCVNELQGNVELRQRLSGQIGYLIVDEYQDVNPLQEKLINEIHRLGANLCVVGDDDQTIYQWRGSDIANILTFQTRYEDVKVVTLENNYRSSKAVVDSARTVIERNEDIRLPKRMESSGHQQSELGEILALHFLSQQQEAEWIANKILDLHSTPFQDSPGSEARGLAWSDFSILVRSVRHSGEKIVSALRSVGIPTIVIGMNNLFDTLEIKAAVGIFGYMCDEIDAMTLKSLWEDADLGLSEESLLGGIAYLNEYRNFNKGTRWAVYNLQRIYLEFLKMVSLREDNVPNGRGEITFYNLGKFSQVISDYEQIHFHSDPMEKYVGFYAFLIHQAPHYYPEGGQDSSTVRPNAVHVMTVHQAKGMEWPVVFVPCLQKNRFPAKRPGGRTKWHFLPSDSIRNSERFSANVDDERRLFYVALTRSQKYLYCSWAPQEDNQLYRKASPFFAEFTQNSFVLTREPNRESKPRIVSRERQKVASVVLSFSELKYYYECPYQFKLRFLYGFNPPLHEALGYGKSLHNVLSEIHKRALNGEIITIEQVPELVSRHLHVPFAYPELRDTLLSNGIKTISRYVQRNIENLPLCKMVEQTIEIDLGNKLLVQGRIDLIKRTDIDQVSIVDFKSTDRAQLEDVSRKQLELYALGYKELMGRPADLIEIHNLDDGRTIREEIDGSLEVEAKQAIIGAGNAIKENNMPRLASWCTTCDSCDLKGICRKVPDEPDVKRVV